MPASGSKKKLQNGRTLCKRNKRTTCAECRQTGTVGQIEEFVGKQ